MFSGGLTSNFATYQTYTDKFSLAECQLNAAVVGVLQSLNLMGLSADKLSSLAGWAAAGASVTLRFSE